MDGILDLNIARYDFGLLYVTLGWSQVLKPQLFPMDSAFAAVVGSHTGTLLVEGDNTDYEQKCLPHFWGKHKS